MTRPTIEDVLADGMCGTSSEWWTADTEIIFEELRSATEDGPIRSEDGTLIVHRADPELAAELLEEARVAEGWCEDMESPEVRHLAYLHVPELSPDLLRRAAALVDGDPEEEGKAK